MTRWTILCSGCLFAIAACDPGINVDGKTHPSKEAEQRFGVANTQPSSTPPGSGAATAARPDDTTRERKEALPLSGSAAPVVSVAPAGPGGAPAPTGGR